MLAWGGGLGGGGVGGTARSEYLTTAASQPGSLESHDLGNPREALSSQGDSLDCSAAGLTPTHPPRNGARK